MFGARVHLSPRKFLQFQPIVRKFMRSSSALSPNVGTERQENSPYVEKVNGILRQYPLESAGTLIGLEISSISGCIAMLKLLGVQSSPELALAFVLTRPIKQFALPLIIGATIGLVKVFPVLGQFEASALFGGALTKAGLPTQPQTTPTTRVVPKSDDGTHHEPAAGSPKWVGKMALMTDKYAVPFMLSSRFIGLSLVLGTYAALKAGVDVAPFLETLGLKTVGNVAGDWAAGVVCSSTIYPFQLMAVPWIAQYLGNLRKSKSSS